MKAPFAILVAFFFGSGFVFGQAGGAGDATIFQNGDGTYTVYNNPSRQPRQKAMFNFDFSDSKKAEKEYLKAKAELAKIELLKSLNEFADVLTRSYATINRADPKAEEVVSFRAALGEMIDDDPNNACDQMLKMQKKMFSEYATKNKNDSQLTKQDSEVKD